MRRDAPSPRATALRSSPGSLSWPYQLVLSGDAACTHSGGAEVYTLLLDEAGAADFAAAIAPDIQSRHVTLTGGEVALEVRNGYLRSIRVTCVGAVRVALLETDASLGADIRFAPAELSPSPRRC